VYFNAIYRTNGTLTRFETFMGVDIVKNSLDVCILDTEKRFSTTNNRTGFRKLLKELPRVGDCLIVVEATGGYQHEMVAELIAAGHPVAVVNLRQVRDFARGLGILAKPDRLACFGQQAKSLNNAGNY